MASKENSTDGSDSDVYNFDELPSSSESDSASPNNVPLEAAQNRKQFYRSVKKLHSHVKHMCDFMRHFSSNTSIYLEDSLFYLRSYNESLQASTSGVNQNNDDEDVETAIASVQEDAENNTTDNPNEKIASDDKTGVKQPASGDTVKEDGYLGDSEIDAAIPRENFQQDNIVSSGNLQEMEKLKKDDTENPAETTRAGDTNTEDLDG